MKTTIAIGADHAGYELKELIKSNFKSDSIDFADFGTHSSDSMDYPDIAHPVAEKVESDLSTFGILICGSANGVAMSANKHAKIRAAICWNSELAELARQHNDANILCLPARFISTEEAYKIVEAFLNAKFEGGRHQRRVDKVSC